MTKVTATRIPARRRPRRQRARRQPPSRRSLPRRRTRGGEAIHPARPRAWSTILPATPVRITLNGDPYDLDQPLSVQELLERLNIDPRRVAVEHNLVILKRHAFAATLVGDGDRVEIVNFVGGG